MSVRFKKVFHDLWDRAREESGVVVDQVGEAFGINSGVDLLNERSFDKVACQVLFHVLLMLASVFGAAVEFVRSGSTGLTGRTKGVGDDRS